eukprot:220729-Prorocentrum_minimum.AAC.1
MTNIISFYGSSCANNGEGAHPEERGHDPVPLRRCTTVPAAVLEAEAVAAVLREPQEPFGPQEPLGSQQALRHQFLEGAHPEGRGGLEHLLGVRR